MSDLGRQLQRANELVSLGRDSQAMDLLLQLLRTHPGESGPIEVCLARAHLVAGRAEEGREHALRAVRAAPSDYGGHLLLGIALHMLQRPAEAVEPLTVATRLDLDDPDAPQRLAQVLTDLGRLTEAYAAAGEAIRRDPHSAKNHFAMGYVLHESNPAEAMRAYRTALELDPHHSGAKHNLAGVAIQGGDWATGTRGMAAVLADSPQAQSPVFLFDQRLVSVLAWLHWLMFGGVIGYGMAASVHPAGALVWVLALLGVGAVIVLRGTKTLRASLPQGGGRYFAGFPRRERIAAIWGGLLGAGWLWLLGSAITGLLVTDGQWAGLGAIVFLFLGWILSWVRVPLARRRAERIRHG
ncbi:tetratricopeptide repeat protein [Granulicoccus sp. GXG6511]|uniref:tetratricopeptide repeat protein n=1 Tax=Granulicoccus sp. GXG6511 TaxID=3381351 RepID=UPI003D7D1674